MKIAASYRLIGAVLFPLLSTFAPETAIAEAPPEIYELGEISVTASRLKRESSEVPAAVGIVGEDKINDARMFNLKEALTGMPGVLIENKNQGYDSRIIIRGAGLKANYGAREIMVLLDGVPVTDPDGLSRLDFIDTQQIKQIEVVKGPNSTLWGANAAGGVINVITKSPLEMQGGNGILGIGNHDTRSLHLSWCDDIKDNFYYALTAGRRQTDNSWRRWNKFETTQGSLSTAFALDDGSVLENYLSYTDASIQLPGKLDPEMFDRYRDTGKARQTEGPWQYSGRYSEVFFFSSRLTKALNNFEIKPIFFFNKWSHKHPITGRINEADTLTYGADIQVDRRHRLLLTEGTLTFGLTARSDDQETDYYKYAQCNTGNGGRIIQVLSDTRGERIETQDRKVNLYGIYIQEVFRPFSRFIIDLGVRYDRVKFHIKTDRSEEYSYSQGVYIPSPALYTTNKTFDDTSPRLGITYHLTDVYNIYCCISKGIQTPTEGELDENPDLDLVTVKNYELGIKARHPVWAFDAAVYYSPVENEVIRVVQPGGDSEYVNSGKTLKKGFEVSGTFSVFPQLELGSGYSYTDYTFDDFTEPVRVGAVAVNMDRSGNKLPFVPRHQYFLSAVFRHPCGFRCRLETFTWGSYYIDNANTEKYKDYELITNAMIGYERGPFELRLNVDNLFDKHCAVAVEKDTNGVVRYIPEAPLRVMVSMKFDFG